MSPWCIALLACWSPQGVPQWEPETVVIDDAQQFQTWKGFGAASVYFEKLPDTLPGTSPGVVRDLAYLQTGANRLRLRIPTELEIANDNGSTTTFNWANFDFGHWYLATEKAYVEAKARGIDFVWASCGSPPAWMKQNAPSGGSLINGGELNPAFYDEFAEFLAAYVVGLQNPSLSGISTAIDIDAISILNEPDYLSTTHETTPTSAVEYAKLVRIVGQKFAALNLDVAILGPECGDVANSTTYLQAIVNDTTSPAAIGFLDGVITHQYGGPTKSGPVQWAALGTLATAQGKEFGETEVAQLGSTNDGILAGLGDVNGIGVSDWILSATNGSDCNHWSYFCYWWDVENPSNPSSTGEGLLRIDPNVSGGYVVPKRFRVFQHYAAHIQPGAVRIQGTGPRDIGVSAWLRPVGGRKEYAIVLSNKTATNYLLTMELPAAPSGPVTTYLTTAALDHAAGVTTPSGSSFHVEVPKESIKTLIVPMGIPTTAGVEVQMTPGVLTGGTFDLSLRYHASSTSQNVKVILARQDPDGTLWYHNSATSSWSTTFGFHQFNLALTDSTEVVFNDQAASFFAEGRSVVYAALLDQTTGLFVGDPSWMDVIADH